MKSYDFLEKHGFGSRDVLNRLARHGVRQESDEVAGMAGLDCDADFAIGLEAANAGSVSGARVHDNEGAASRIYRGPGRRNDPHEYIIDGARERATIGDEFGLIFEHMRNRLGEVFAILISALTHHVQIQHAAFGGVDPIVKRSRYALERTLRTGSGGLLL